MEIQSYQPTALLQPYIREYKVISSENDKINRLLPEPSQVLVFRIRGQVNDLTDTSSKKIPTLTLTGLKNSFRLVNYTPHSTNILVLFKVAGAAAFFKEPMHHFFEQSVSLENFIKQSEISILEDRLGLAKDHASRIQIIEHFLLSRLHHSLPDQLVMDAIQKIHQTNGLSRIRNLAASLYISQDAFEKRFRKRVGAAAKQYSFIVRMKNLIGNQNNNSFTEAALDAGFFDQSHFNKHFKLFTGQTPTDYFSSSPTW